MRQILSGAVLAVCVTAAAAPLYAENEPDAGTPAMSPDAGPPDAAPAPLPRADAAPAPAPTPEAAPAAPAPAADAAVAPAATAPAESPNYETTIKGRRPFTAASNDTIRARDFLLRPHLRPADILQVTPGLFVFQHAGGGKANQYFLRGFDADHGTDLAIFVDGVPVNMLSHGHGQGFADLHFVIPETIERVDVEKGPYDPRYGDLETAGAFNMVTRKEVEMNSVQLSGGSFDTYRALAMVSPHAEDTKALLASEIYLTNGPFIHGEDLRRYNLFATVEHKLSDHSAISGSAMSYGGGWYGSGQLPARAIGSAPGPSYDFSTRFGYTDPGEGGNSSRESVYVRYHLDSPDSQLNLLVYDINYRLRLYSNFTLFARDPVHGDEIEQDDVRTVQGFDGSYRKLYHLPHGQRLDSSFGMQSRTDTGSTGLDYDQARKRLMKVIDADQRDTEVGVYALEDLSINQYLRAVLGIRGDYFGVDVTDNLEDYSNPNPTSGTRKATIASPKASLVLSPMPGTLDVFANFGSGFHSNDARALVQQGDLRGTPLVRALGYELGSRAHLPKLDLAASLWLLDLDSEIVWAGDQGTTEASGATRRYGVEFEGRAELLPWLFADLDVTATHSAFKANAGNGNGLALAPKLTLQAGLSARHPAGWYGRIGVIHIGDRPANDDGSLTAQGFTRLDASAGYHRKYWELGIYGQNLTNTVWREAQFATTSRLPSETKASDCPKGTNPKQNPDGSFLGCEDVDFTPGAPINVLIAATLYF